MMKQLAWCPNHEPQFLMMGEEAFQQATAVWLPADQILKPSDYWQALSNRVQKLIDEAEYPKEAMKEIFVRLAEERLAEITLEPERIDRGGRDLIVENMELRLRLDAEGVLDKFPKEISKNNPEAQEILETLNWEEWLNAITAIRQDRQ